MTEKIEYRVRPVTRYIVTRYHEADRASGCSGHGEFDNFETAYAVGYALAKQEHEKLGWSLDDPRMQYPKQIIRGGDEHPYDAAAHAAMAI